MVYHQFYDTDLYYLFYTSLYLVVVLKEPEVVVAH